MIGIHPSLVMVPDEGRVAEWVRAVGDLVLIKPDDGEFVFSKTALAAGYEAGLVASLRTLVARIDAQSADPLSLATVIEALLERVAWVEDLPTIHDVSVWEIEPESLVDPAIPGAEQLPLIILAVASAASGAVMVAGHGGHPNALLRVLAGSRLTADGWSTLDGSEYPFAVVNSAHGWLRLQDPGMTASAYQAALAGLAKTCDEDCFRPHVALVAIHPQFPSSSGYRAGSASLRRTALRKSAQLIHGGTLAESRPLRQDGRQTSPGRVSQRHGGRAMRVHVTKSKEGYRLHLWALPDGRIELASLEPKSYVDIPD
jgi:hypothetical protein